MADWCSLPDELLYSISLRLPTSTDILRLRSVCSTWRSSVDPPATSSASCYYVIHPQSQIFNKGGGFCLTKRTIYALKSIIPGVSSSWIIKLERDKENNRLLIFNPLNQSRYKTFPETFPNSFDILNFRIKELGQEYTLHHIKFGPLANSNVTRGDIYKEKVAVLHNYPGDGDFVILTITKSGHLVIYKSCEKKWKRVQGFILPYVDVIPSRGRFYAVDMSGRLVLVNHVDFSMTTVANPFFGIDKNFLFDSDGELLLVRRYGTNMEFPRKLWVFRLDENVRNWIEVSDLRDKMLFFGDNCMFCASAYDIFGDDHNNREGNRIFFMERGRIFKMFDIKSGSIDPLGSRTFLKLITPPAS